MEKRAWWEWGGLVSLVVLLLVSLYPALQYARAERRDGIRRHELRQFKQLMELRNNDLGYYPATLDVAPHDLRITDQTDDVAKGWILRAWLENYSPPEVGFDEEYNVYYRIGQEGDRTYYDICGGIERCGAENREL